MLEVQLHQACGACCSKSGTFTCSLTNQTYSLSSRHAHMALANSLDDSGLLTGFAALREEDKDRDGGLQCGISAACQHMQCTHIDSLVLMKSKLACSIPCISGSVPSSSMLPTDASSRWSISRSVMRATYFSSSFAAYSSQTFNCKHAYTLQYNEG